MCHKIRCDEESCKVLGFLVHLNKALGLVALYIGGIITQVSSPSVPQVDGDEEPHHHSLGMVVQTK